MQRVGGRKVAGTRSKWGGGPNWETGGGEALCGRRRGRKLALDVSVFFLGKERGREDAMGVISGVGGRVGRAGGVMVRERGKEERMR